MNVSLAPLFRQFKGRNFPKVRVRRHEGGPKHLRVEAPAHANKLELAYLPVRVSPTSPAVRPSSCTAACLTPSQFPWLPSRSARSLPSSPLPRPLHPSSAWPGPRPYSPRRRLSRRRILGQHRYTSARRTARTVRAIGR